MKQNIPKHQGMQNTNEHLDPDQIWGGLNFPQTVPEIQLAAQKKDQMEHSTRSDHFKKDSVSMHGWISLISTL